MKKFILTISLLLMIGSARSQWISTYSGSNIGDNSVFNEKGAAICADNSGNCYITGYTIGQGTGYDILTIKFNSSGDTLWERTYNGTGNQDDRGFGIAVDNSGNVYVAGTASFTGTSNDIVLLKYNSSGVLKWTSSYSGSTHHADDEGLALALDPGGYIYVTGYCTDNDNSLNMVTLKFKNNGNLMWSKLEKGTRNQDCEGFGIAVDHLGNIDVTGYTTARTGADVLLVQYRSNGTKNWSRTYNNPAANSDDKAFGIAVDAADNIIISGYTTNATRSNTDCLTIKYSSQGNFQWLKTYNGGAGKNDRALGIAVDTDGSIYIAGYAASVANGNDYVTIKYTPSGTQSWVSLYDGPVHGDDRANAISVIHNASGNTTGIAVTGQSWGISNNYDYATVRYSNINGNQLQVSRYEYTIATNDIATSVATWNNNIYVTGYSESNSGTVNGNQLSVISTLELNWSEAAETLTKDLIPDKFCLYQNYPNPFNPSTNITFDLPTESTVKLVVYDLTGRQVSVLVDGYLKPGSHVISFTGSNLSSGIYIYELTAAGFRDVRKMSLIK